MCARHFLPCLALSRVQGHLPVVEYVTPEAFNMWTKLAEDLGFLYAAGGPMVRSSYRAGEFYLENLLKRQKEAQQALRVGQ